VFQNEEKHVYIRSVVGSAVDEHLLGASPTIKTVYRSRKIHYEVMKK
jgi:hypothetical protein